VNVNGKERTMEGEAIEVRSQTKFTTKELRCVLTTQERLEMGDELSKETTAAEQAEDRKKAVGAQLKADVDEHNAKCRRLASVLSAGYEYREVKCEETWDYDAGLVTVFRTDTGEAVTMRKMTAQEQQLHMDV
jgi:hypothetical protein